MGLDLKLIPVDYEGFALAFGHSMLEFGLVSYDLPKQLKSAVVPAPKDFTSFVAQGRDGEVGYGVVTCPYGNPMTCATAGDLIRLLPTGGRQREAALAYLRALPAEHKIVLFWH